MWHLPAIAAVAMACCSSSAEDIEQVSRDEVLEAIAGLGLALDSPEADVILALHGAYVTEMCQYEDDAALRLSEIKAARDRFLAEDGDLHTLWLEEGEDFGYRVFFATRRAHRREQLLRFEGSVESVLAPLRSIEWRSWTQGRRRARVFAEIRERTGLRATYDLTEVATALDLTSFPIVQLLENYAIDLNDALVAWEEEFDTLNARIKVHVAERQRHRTRAAERHIAQAQERLRDLGAVAFRINQQYLGELAGLCGESATELQYAVAEIEYPQVFRPSPAELAFDLLEDERLDAPSREAVNQLRGEFESAVAQARLEIVAALRTWDDPDSAVTRQRERDVIRIRREGGDLDQLCETHPVCIPLLRYHELVRGYCVRLEAQLGAAVSGAYRVLLGWAR